MTNEEWFQAGYADYWNAQYNPPQEPEANEYYMRGYRQAEQDISNGDCYSFYFEGKA